MRRPDDLTKKLRNVDLNLLKTFDAVLEEQSISKAASMLCVSQPAVSNSLRRLRSLYDDPLFVRTTSGMMPTPKAQELTKSIRNALIGIDTTFQEDEEFDPSKSQRTFTVALTDYGELFFLPEILKRLRVEAPGIDIICSPDPGESLSHELKSGAVDLVWDWSRIEEPEFSTEEVLRDIPYCLLRKSHPIANDTMSIDQYLQAKHIALRPRRFPTLSIGHIIEEKGYEQHIGTEVSHISVMPHVVARTNFVATLPERAAKYYAQEMNLQALPHPIAHDKVGIYQMWHKSYEGDEGHKWFRKLTREVCENFSQA